jgi:CDP-paratose 2-epimerase
VRIFISGISGFAGSCIAHGLLDHDTTIDLLGMDNFNRSGSYVNVEPLRGRGVKLLHGDVRCSSDLEFITDLDWIIDAAANPSVLAGMDGVTSSRQVVENNLYGTINLLELANDRGLDSFC